jgi:phage/plasmid-like protein (TIGR03299 family)
MTDITSFETTGFRQTSPTHAEDESLKLLSLHEILERTNLDFQAVKVPTEYRLPGSEFQFVSHSHSIVRADNGDELGYGFSEDYTVVQHENALDSIFGDVRKLDGTPTRAIGFRGGAKVAVQFRLPATLETRRHYGLYFTLYNSFDGTSPIGFNWSGVAIVCGNTYRLAFANAEGKFTTRHTKNVGKRLGDAARAVGIARTQFIEWGETLKRLSEKRLDTPAVEAFLAALLPDTQAENKSRGNKRDRILAAIDTSLAEEGADWASAETVFNGVTRYVDYNVSQRDDARQIEYALIGSGAQLKQKAWNILTAPVAVAAPAKRSHKAKPKLEPEPMVE